MTLKQEFPCVREVQDFHIYQVVVARIALLTIPSPEASHLTDALNTKDVYITFVRNEGNKRES